MRALVVLACLLLVGCGTAPTSEPALSERSATPPGRTSASTSPTPTIVASPSARTTSPEPSRSGTSAQPRGTTVITADSQFGSMLYDASGQAIYLFDAEGGSRPECYDECAKDWPPVLTTGSPRAEAKVRSNLLGTTRRRDGKSQVTYAGHPLYFYAHEGKYQVLCHDIEEYGGTWLVVQPDGKPAPS